MSLLDRLNKVIDKHDLEPKYQIIKSREINEEIYDNLESVTKDKIEFDEFDTKVVIVKEIGFKEIRLPQKLNGVIIDDIQKSVSGNYIVNLTRI